MRKISDLIKLFSKEIPQNEIRILLCKILNYSLEELILNQESEISRSDEEKLSDFIERRTKNEPIAYIIGEKEFYGLNFCVDNSVLIPRPETEFIVDNLIKYAIESSKILDLCTGSGCIAIAAAVNLEAEICATDISEKALIVAHKNSVLNKIENKIRFFRSNWFESISASEKFDIITCNPPYIGEGQKELMAKETVMFEPHIALFAQNDGLAPYEIIAKLAANYLNDGGKVILECGVYQGQKIVEIFEHNNWELLEITKDLAGIDRCLVFRPNLSSAK